ncbi:MAG: DUF4168 domain-containing protein [Bacteroidales bacterium]
MFKTNLKAISGILVMLLFSLPLFAQVGMEQQGQQDDEITDEDLKKFAKVSEDLDKMQEESNAEMEEIIKKNGMELQRFNEIMQAKRSGQEVEMEDGEEEKFQKINQELQEYQQGNQQKAVDVLDKRDLSQQKYMAIRQKLQTDKELQQRLEKIQE